MSDNNNQIPQTYPTINQAVGELIIRTFGSTASDIGPHFTTWSLNNIRMILSSVRSYIENNKIENLKSIPDREIYTLLHCASQEDNESIQKLWVGLIANSIDPSKNQNINRHLINILAQLDPVDAQIIQYIDEKNLEIEERINLFAGELVDKLQIDSKKIGFSLLNMARLGLFEVSYTSALLLEEKDKSMRGNPYVNIDYDHFDAEATNLLFHLIGACKK